MYHSDKKLFISDSKIRFSTITRRRVVQRAIPLARMTKGCRTFEDLVVHMHHALAGADFEVSSMPKISRLVFVLTLQPSTHADLLIAAFKQGIRLNHIRTYHQIMGIRLASRAKHPNAGSFIFFCLKYTIKLCKR
jgi:hypothetical protein